ncbi:MAG TPA: cold shock domain-containing protein [Chitinophaga sp.]
MARPNESSNKHENEKKKRQHKQEKQEKKEARKASKQGKSLEDMLAYVDENGNITSTPPDPTKKKEINLEDIQLGVPRQDAAAAAPADGVRRGVVKFFNESKGYGFIIDQHTQESVFVHIRQLQEPIKEKDKVVFEIEQGQKGPSAVNVKKG